MSDTSSDTLYPAALTAAVTEAVETTRARLRALLPKSAGRVETWMQALAGGREAAAYFTHPYAFPTLLFPWWVDEGLRPDGPDLLLQRDLVRSSVNGYYFIRMIDDVMDGGGKGEVPLLPALGFFHAEFQAIYARLFPSGHPFWELFDRQWGHTADAAIADAALKDVDAEVFREVSAGKVSAGKIPMRAVAWRAGAELAPAWESLFDRMSRWHQFHNDFFDWRRDLEQGIETYVLSEARRRKRPDEAVELWMVREGFEWGVATLEGWLAEMLAGAEALPSPGFAAYLRARGEKLGQTVAAARPGLEMMARLLRAAGGI